MSEIALLNLLVTSDWSEQKTQQALALIKSDINVNCFSQKNLSTPLQIASRDGLITIVKCLIDHGADINQIDKAENSALMLAANEGHCKIVELLIAKGANIHHENKNGNTALLLAAWEVHADVVQCLLNHGAKSGHKNKLKFNALELLQKIVSTGDIITCLSSAIDREKRIELNIGELRYH